MLGQIILGSLFLMGCCMLHVTVLFFAAPATIRAILLLGVRRGHGRRLLLLGGMLGAIILAHTLQIWIWAAYWLAKDALPDLNEAVYFSIVTYTTLGYGDIVLGPDYRIVATFAAITGLLAFAISTAFLIGLVTRMMPEPDFGDPDLQRQSRKPR
ncbi:potassium channel family protein [Sulfitobacter sp. S190]|uniref:potassium channel family protein n=1 Tax=Sulfitobacter sp. S190 TaxID=2867022 RepID=UPI0021A37B8B|nr:potassium channel family protein [Sulfitobacter sp. S190]UWR21131.1 potassium channel family protein [Sulfitobacter sp. S190]